MNHSHTYHFHTYTLCMLMCCAQFYVQTYNGLSSDARQFHHVLHSLSQWHDNHFLHCFASVHIASLEFDGLP